MIVRTAPELLRPEVVRVPVTLDVVRVLERLEAQLRRAADDLADALPDLRMAADAITETARREAIEAARILADDQAFRDAGRCGRHMTRGRRCHRRLGHQWECRSREAMDRDAARRKAA